MDYHNYFITLEDKFLEISKYVEIDPKNFGTFSSEIAFLFMASCSEFEVVSKELCKILNPEFISEGAKIVDIKKCLHQSLPEIFDEVVDVLLFRMEFKPLKIWSNKTPPTWWSAYNGVKHRRSEDYHLANLDNLIRALSALQIVNLYLVWKRDFPERPLNACTESIITPPRVFVLNGISYGGPQSSEFGFVQVSQ